MVCHFPRLPSCPLISFCTMASCPQVSQGMVQLQMTINLPPISTQIGPWLPDSHSKPSLCPSQSGHGLACLVLALQGASHMWLP